MISLAVGYEGGAVTYVDVAEEDPESGCVDRLEIAVKVSLTSAGGELAEVVDGVAWATSADTLGLVAVSLFQPALTGTLDLGALMGADLTLDSLDLRASLDARQGTGALNGEASHAVLGSIGYGTIATFVVGAPM